VTQQREKVAAEHDALDVAKAAAAQLGMPTDNVPHALLKQHSRMLFSTTDSTSKDKAKDEKDSLSRKESIFDIETSESPDTVLLRVAEDALEHWAPSPKSLAKRARKASLHNEGAMSEHAAKLIAEQTAVQMKEVMKGMRTMSHHAGGGGDTSDISTLLQACSRGDLRAVQVWEAAGGDLRAVDYDKRSGLHLSCAGGHLHLVKYLLQKGATANMVDAFNRSPLDEAIQNEHTELEQWLRANGATKQCTTPEVSTIYNAIRFPVKKVVKTVYSLTCACRVLHYVLVTITGDNGALLPRRMCRGGPGEVDALQRSGELTALSVVYPLHLLTSV
jgi:hypothetical protein